jgi:hypothetical protein
VTRDSIWKFLGENSTCGDLHSFCCRQALFFSRIGTPERGAPFETRGFE